MKKYMFVLVLVLGLIIATYSLAFADNGPHGGYAAATDACAGCHRAHTAQISVLLVVSSTSLCQTCHSSTGTGADTNVWDGVYLERDGVAENPVEGVTGRGLKGGGFQNALMDTDDGTIAGVSPSRPATSAHTFSGAAGTNWGNGANGSGAGPSVALSCTNCHNPHGRAGTGGAATYRILRPVPTGSGGAGVTVADEVAKTYSITSTAGVYWAEPYAAEATISAWCSQCHTRYLAGANSAQTDSGDAIYRFRHTTNSNGVACTDCHVAHGTAAVMGANSGSVAWPDGTVAPSGNARSSLLRLDNRGVCFKCHATP